MCCTFNPHCRCDDININFFGNVSGPKKNCFSVILACKKRPKKFSGEAILYDNNSQQRVRYAIFALKSKQHRFFWNVIKGVTCMKRNTSKMEIILGKILVLVLFLSTKTAAEKCASFLTNMWLPRALFWLWKIRSRVAAPQQIFDDTKVRRDLENRWNKFFSPNRRVATLKQNTIPLATKTNLPMTISHTCSFSHKGIKLIRFL